MPVFPSQRPTYGDGEGRVGSSAKAEGLTTGQAVALRASSGGQSESDNKRETPAITREALLGGKSAFGEIVSPGEMSNTLRRMWSKRGSSGL